MTSRIDNTAKPKPEWELAWSSENPGLAAKYERDQLPESRQWERSGFKYGYLAGAKAAEQREASGGWVAVAYPGAKPPAVDTLLVVAPSGFIECIYRGQPLNEGWRIVRYVIAPPTPPEGSAATEGE